MDPMDDFSRGYRRIWPADIDPIDEAELTVENGRVSYRGSRLKAPFHKGLILADCIMGVNEAIGSSVAISLSSLLRDHVGAVELMRSTAARVDLRAKAAGARLIRYVPVRFCANAFTPFMVLSCQIEMIDDALERRTLHFDLGDENSSAVRSVSETSLRRELKAQPARREKSGRGLGVDPVLAWHLAALTEMQLVKLADLLATSPGPQANDRSRPFEANWDRSRLARHGIAIPEAITSMRVRNGNLEGQIRLGDTLTWNAGTFTTTTTIPETVTLALIGRPVTTLANHPSMSGLKIVRTNIQRNKLTTVKVDLEGAMLPFPSGLRNLR